MGKSVITFKKVMLDVWYVLTVEENIFLGSFFSGSSLNFDIFPDS